MKKALLLVIATGAITTGWLLIKPVDAYACNRNITTCGYFYNKNENATCNVLPDPSNWCPASGGDKSLLYGVRDVNSFVNVLSNYLQTGGYTSYDFNARVGAAFLVDDMLGIDYQNESATVGLNSARSNFNYWKSIVYSLAAHTCAGSGNSGIACPGTTFGINWDYTPSLSNFCSSSHSTPDSGYDPGSVDASLYPIGAVNDGLCSYAWSESQPEIVLYWNGGTSSFRIGSRCGNAEEVTSPLPPPNSNPSGSLSVACNAATGSQVATASVSDPNGATTGYITVGGWQSGLIGSGGSNRIAIPAWVAGPYNAVIVDLYARDVGPLSSGNYQLVATAFTQVPCVTFGCGSINVTPTPLDPGMKFNATVSVTNSGSTLPPAATMQLTINSASGGSFTYNNSQVAGGSGATSTATFMNIGPTIQTGLYNAQWILIVAGLPSTVCNGSFSVVNLPIVNIYGGDVRVGASPSFSGGTSSCAIDNNAGAYSWNNHATNFSGAGAQYAVQALAQIEDVASALNSSNSTPVGLSFANTYTPADPSKLNLAQGLFGGSFGATTSDCDFTSNIGVAPTTGDKTIGAIMVNPGTNMVTYISNGDVYVSGNIAYGGTGGWASISQIPSFKLVVVGGDIYIGNNVTQLDGLYVAEPSGGSGGHIYTCATAIRAAVDLAVAGSYITCHKQLVINGAFVAKQVQFSRTFGTVGNAKPTDTVTSNDDAEVFNYTPELWLPRGVNPPGTGYAAITGLPPVL